MILPTTTTTRTTNNDAGRRTEMKFTTPHLAKRGCVEANPMRLGVAYNVFDAHELLEPSLRSVRSCASHVVVVWQRISNFGDKCHPHLEAFLKECVERKLVDTLIEYAPRGYSVEERKQWVSTKAEGLEGPVETIGPQFFNEIAKREIGRKHLLDSGCTHFLLMDCDECYLEEELRFGMRIMQERGYDSSACRMRLFLKGPQYEYFPYDNFQAVSFICKLRADAPLRLACPFAGIMVDPTRRMEPHGNMFFFDRGSVEMYHYTFVRMDMAKKLGSVSNKANYEEADAFLKAIEHWKPEDGVIHPHPHIGAQYTHIKICPNYFGIDLKSICNVCYLRECPKKHNQ